MTTLKRVNGWVSDPSNQPLPNLAIVWCRACIQFEWRIPLPRDEEHQHQRHHQICKRPTTPTTTKTSHLTEVTVTDERYTTLAFTYRQLAWINCTASLKNFQFWCIIQTLFIPHHITLFTLCDTRPMLTKRTRGKPCWRSCQKCTTGCIMKSAMKLPEIVVIWWWFV